MMAGKQKYFAHLGGALVIGSAGLLSMLAVWESGGPEPILTVYADTLAEGLPTVCHGLTRHVTKTPIIVGEVWTREKCDHEELQALEKVQTQVAYCFKVLPPQDVFDAVSSHAWNNGAPATCGSLAMQAFNAQNWELGCTRLSKSDAGRPVWSFTSRMVNGKKVYTFRQGLANRREYETGYCLEGLPA